MANYKVQLNPETNAYDVTRGRSIYGTIPAEEMQSLFPAINPESVITAEGLDESDKANSVRIAVTVDGETSPVEVLAKKDAPEGSETKDPDEAHKCPKGDVGPKGPEGVVISEGDDFVAEAKDMLAKSEENLNGYRSEIKEEAVQFITACQDTLREVIQGGDKDSINSAMVGLKKAWESAKPEEKKETQPKSNPDVVAEIRRRRGKTSTQIRRNMVEERRAKVANPNDPKSVLEYRRNNRK